MGRQEATEEQQDGHINTQATQRKTKKRMNTPTPKLVAARLSKKRSRHDTLTPTPWKRLRLGALRAIKSRSISSDMGTTEMTPNPSHWDECDTKGEAQA